MPGLVRSLEGVVLCDGLSCLGEVNTFVRFDEGGCL